MRSAQWHIAARQDSVIALSAAAAGVRSDSELIHALGYTCDVTHAGIRQIDGSSISRHSRHKCHECQPRIENRHQIKLVRVQTISSQFGANCKTSCYTDFRATLSRYLAICNHGFSSNQQSYRNSFPGDLGEQLDLSTVPPYQCYILLSYYYYW